MHFRVARENKRDAESEEARNVLKISNVMAKNIRRAAKKAINSRDSHRLLGLVIFDQKIVCESLKKTASARANASLSVLKWAREEENLALQDVFSKVFEVSSMWTSVWKEFSDEFLCYRRAFKEVLQQERALDEVRKKEIACVAKLNKLQKQLDVGKKKNGVSSTRSHDSLAEEIGQVLSEAEQARAELEVKVTKHEIFKAIRLREALQQISGSLETFAKKTLSVCNAYRNLAKDIPDTPTQLSESGVFPGAGKTRSIVSDLADELGLEPEYCKGLAKDGTPLETYLYSVSPPIKNCRVPVIEVDKNEKSHDESGTISERKHISKTNQVVARPLSWNDLRPRPPVAPKPVFQKTSSPKQGGSYEGLKLAKSVPILTKRKISAPSGPQDDDENLWYARTGKLDADSDDDSDGYTEPLETYPRKSAGRLFSDGALKEVQKGDVSEFVDPSSGRIYAILSRDPSNDDDCADQDDAVYLEVIGS